MKLNNRAIKAELLRTNKFSKVKFSKAPRRQNKWAVGLQPKVDPTMTYFHISYVDGGFRSQDEFVPPHKMYYPYPKTVKPRLATTPLGAIHKVAILLNNGYRIHKL